MAGAAPRAGRQAQGAGLLLSLGAVAGVACANVEPPPGGPLDAQPPALVRVLPESGAVVPSLRDAVVLQFDEVIDEMGGGGGGGGGSFGGGGAAGLDGQILLSPVTGDVDVSWRRTAIGVKPREGWRRGRVYRLELLPGIRDLRGNRLGDGRVVVFSTGPAIPTAVVSGTALDWTGQRALARGLIRVAPRGDTTGYLARVDSAGGFRIAAIPPGEYVVHALQDENGNRRLDRREAYDSALVRIDSSATAVLWTFVHDTAGPRLRSADPVDSVTFRLVFAQHLDPHDRPDTARLRLIALPDSTPVPVAQVLWPAQYDSLTARERAAADSARRAQGDTVAPRAPGAPGAAAAGGPGAAKPRPAPAQPPAAGVPGAAGARGAAAKGTPAAGAPSDTAALRRLLAQRPVPFDRLVVRVRQPLAADAKYLVRVTGARNLNGAVADGQAVLTMPKRAAPRDTTPPR